MVSNIVKEPVRKLDTFKEDDPLSTGSSHSLPTKMMIEQKRRPLIGAGSLRDKFAKFKDASFRLTRHNSGLQIVDGIPVEFVEGTALRRTESKTGRKKVHFNLESNDVRLFELPDVPQLELWWSSDELNTSRCDGKLCAAVEATAQEYCRAFDRAYRQVHTDRKLTAAYLTELVKGLDVGYRGLEQYGVSNKRKLAIREHVMSVVRCYRERSHPSGTSLTMDDSVHSVGSNRSGSTSGTGPSSSATNTCSLERTVRNHSAKLSAGNRHFAAAMGKAERLAAYAPGANGGAPAAA